MEDRFVRLRELIDQALALPRDQREAWVRAACAGDGDLGDEALDLLVHAAGDDRHLTGLLDGQVRAAALGALGADVLPGAIGPYRIVAKLGEGGMGVVYRAEQTGALERSVALKLIRVGWNSARVVARFESERRTLARMDHPNIARVYDAGSTVDGRPWFAMELVEGRRLTDWCDERRLGTRGRLELFLAVCRGVQHAHQKGIIHRDLKPSNVLVSGAAAEPEPKIIDFGIAKALAVPDDPPVDMTLTGQLLGSPDYMSPERIEGSDDDADIRSDVYSLGVLFFELLSGRLPFDRGAHLRAGFGSGTAAGTRADPPPLAAAATGDLSLAGEIAARRGTDPSALRRRLAGELDWIAAKALDPRRDHRYGTALELMQDIQRHLAGEPVLAGRPGAVYRLGKFVRRHAVPLALVAAVFVGLIGGLAESQRQRRHADTARAEAESVTAFLANMLESARPDEQGRDVTVRRVLDGAAVSVDAAFGDEPLVRARLQSTIGMAYVALGENVPAIAQLEAVVATRRRELGDRAAGTLMALCNLGQAYGRVGRFDEEAALYREALAGFRSLDGDQVAGICRAMNGLANALADRGRLAEAEPLYLEALAACERHLGPQDPQTHSVLNNLALLRAEQGDMGAAAEILARVLELRREHEGPLAPKTMESELSLAGVQSQLGHLDEAAAVLEPLLLRARRELGDSHRVTLAALNNLAWCYARQGRLVDAEALNREAWAIRRNFLGPDHPETLISAHNTADVLRRRGRLAEAEQLHRDTLAARRRALGADHPHVGISRAGLAEVLQEQGRGREAAALLAGSPHPD